MKKKLFALILLAGASSYAQLSIGVSIGPPPPARILRVRPSSPGPGYVWVEGYWYPMRNRYKWHNGYWTRPPYAGSYWVSPRYEGGHFMDGHWEGGRGQRDHDHRWDNRRDRDFGR